MLDEFTSVFTCEDTFSISRVECHSYPDIDQLKLNQEGVAELLSLLDANKASGPHNIPCCIFKELALEIAPVITAICGQSLELGTLPCDGKEAIISPVYKKGNVHLASNYRPVSLACVNSKIMEHMICKHIHNHLEKYDILTSF